MYEDARDIPIEILEEMNRMMDKIIARLERFERNILSQLDDWIVETRRARLKFQKEFFPEKPLPCERRPA